MTRLSRTSYPGVSYCHQLWTNADGTILYVDDELDELNGRTPTTRTLVFDVTDLSNPVLINTFTSGYPAVDHNLYVRDGFIFEANYTIGLRVFDANSDPVDPVEVGYFDTHPETNGADFNGLWSVYPYFDGSTVIGSDINRGMFVLDISGILAGLVFDYPGGRPNMISPDGGTSFTLNVSGRNVTHTEDTGLLHYNDGSGWNEVPLTYIGSGEYDVVFPATTCGEVVQYYVSAESDELGRETDPDGAPANSFSALSANGLTELFGDTFETDLGWTVENVDLQDGAWERGVPAGDGDRGDPLSDHDGSGSCYLTDNVAGNSDVDGGPTRLISPTFDLSDGDARVSYALWHSTDESDPMVTEISNNNGANWTVVENRTSSTGGWLVMSWDVSTYIAPTATMKVRFSVSDNPNDSVTESGLDAFTVERTNCGEPNNCLDLVVTNLVAGDKANWDVAGASAGGTVAVVYGLQSGKTVLDDHLDYCATFDIKGVNATRVICVKAADGNGDVHCTKNIPGNFAGVRVFSQAAERDTCPEECMSNLDDQTIQ